MILSDSGIRRAIQNGELAIDPALTAEQYQTSALDIHLGNVFQEWNYDNFSAPGTEIVLNLSKYQFKKTAGMHLRKPNLENDGTIVLRPYQQGGQCLPMLAMTREKVTLKHDALLAARVEGRSSLARLGLVVHLTAPTIHAGFNAQITLEMVNHGPFYLKLVPNETLICQLIFERLETAPEMEMSTQFQGQTKPAGK